MPFNTESNDVKVQFFIACSGPDNTTAAATVADLTTALSDLNTIFTNTTINFSECSPPIFMFNSTHFNMDWDCVNTPSQQNINEDGMCRRFDKKNTINIYVVNRIIGADLQGPCEVIGYAHYYGDLYGQKVSTGIHNRIFMAPNATNLVSTSLSRLLGHEMGHFFGLKHLNGDLDPGNTLELVKRGTSSATVNWNITADYLEDTPADPCTISYISPSTCDYPFDPNPANQGCGSSFIVPYWCDPNGDLFVPLQDNIMFPNSNSCPMLDLTPQQEGFVLDTYNLLFSTKFNGAADLVSRDNWGDPGFEGNVFANLGSWYDIWGSPDLWNCDNSNNCTFHQNPAHQGSNNNLKVRVTNNGCSTSDPAELNMYWTMGSTGEIWPQAWDGTQQLNGQNAGGLITPSPLIIPALNAGQSHIATQNWTPVDPAIFNMQLLNHMDGKPMICFLSRFSSPSDPINNEQLNVHAGDNVIASNNLVTRNTSIVNLPSNIIGPTTTGVVNQFIRNDLDDVASINLNLENIGNSTDAPFSEEGKIIITLDNSLWASWASNGYQGTGISIYNAEEHQIEITNTEIAEIQQIEIAAETTQEIEFCYYLISNASISEYQFLLGQTLNETNGTISNMGTACRYHVNVVPPGTGKKSREIVLVKRYLKGSNQFIIHPNPVTNNFVLQYELDQKSNIEIGIYDLLGKNVYNETYYNMRKGYGSQVIEFNKFKSGYYILKIKYDSGEDVIKFIKY